MGEYDGDEVEERVKRRLEVVGVGSKKGVEMSSR